MPAYISHVIMGEEVYKKAVNDSLLFKTEVDFESYKTYTMGADLANFSKRAQVDSHNKKTRLFFLTFCKYIKEHHLEENSRVIACLYGHIAHYFLDVNVHPLIYYLEYGSKQIGILPNHHLIEGYLSSYLVKKIIHDDIMNFKVNRYNGANLNEKTISNMLNDVYNTVYKDNHIIKSYQKVIDLINLLEKTYKEFFHSKKFVLDFSQFQQFIDANNLTKTDILNENHNTWTNPVTGKKQHNSFLELYQKSINMTLDAIYEVNNYLYNNKPLNTLKKTFTDLSYDTGVKCFLGKKLIYVKKR